MPVEELTKKDLKKLQKTKLGGSDGKLFLDSSRDDRILKLLYNNQTIEQIQNQITLLCELKKELSLSKIAATPKEIVYAKHLNQLGFWMESFLSGVRFDIWIKQNEENVDKIIDMFRKISQRMNILHKQYGIIITDCYYNNILIVDDEFPIFVDVNSWSKGELLGNNISKIVYDFSSQMWCSRYQKSLYLKPSQNGDNVALWLMYFESVLKLPIKNTRKLERLKESKNIPHEIWMLYDQMRNPVLENIPYFHDASKQMSLHK